MTAYLSDTIQKQFLIKNVYASVDEFCARVRAICGFRFTQIDNVFGRASDIFQQIGNIFGLDLPEKVQLKVGYGDIPVHEGRCIIDRFQKKRDEFQDVVIIACTIFSHFNNLHGYLVSHTVTRAVAKESILSPFADQPLHCYREDNTGVPIFYPHNMLCSAHLQYDTQIYLQLQSLYAQFHKKGVRPRFLTNTMCNRAVHLQIPM